ncbi:MAG TPA: alanine dehydrogenase [Phycisphaerae bacterium]|nr:alanine dehydrogenase [Phycisphaerae bacterium]
MRIGIPREIKDNENRVGMVPAGVEELTKRGHEVFVETGAGLGSDLPDESYQAAGAKTAARHEDVFANAELVVKVKEPLAQEYPLIRRGQILFAYFHFSADRELTQAMAASGGTCIAYETVEDRHGRLPLLIPMSEIAGRMAVQEGAKCLATPMLGRGILLGGVPGVPPANVLILGGGTVGANAARVAAGLGANVTIMDIDLDRLRFLADVMPANVSTLMCNSENIRRRLPDADLVVGTVLVRGGARAPRLVPRDLLKRMRPGSVIVDVAVDQGGCVETTRPTTHSDPTFVVDGVVHYCVTNMPGAVPGTSTPALTNATLPYVLQIVEKGYPKAVQEDPGLAKGVNILNGRITNRPVADALGLRYTPLDET